jgi:hypothetical protein
MTGLVNEAMTMMFQWLLVFGAFGVAAALCIGCSAQEDPSNAEAVRINQAIDAYTKKGFEIIEYWNEYMRDQKKLTLEEQRARVRECIRLSKQIDPFTPPRVNSELAAAIGAVKERKIAYFEVVLKDLYWRAEEHTESEAEQIKEEFAAAKSAQATAEADLREVIARLRAKYNP